MNEYINIVPVICEVKENNLDKISILNDKPFKSNVKTAFCVSIFSSIYINRDLKIKLLLRHTSKKIGLDMGTIDIVKKDKDESHLYHNTYFFNVETTFPEEGIYALEIFLVDENNIEDETEARPIAATILEVR